VQRASRFVCLRRIFGCTVGRFVLLDFVVAAVPCVGVGLVVTIAALLRRT
jgi:hypothetical protein